MESLSLFNPEPRNRWTETGALDHYLFAHAFHHLCGTFRWPIGVVRFIKPRESISPVEAQGRLCELGTWNQEFPIPEFVCEAVRQSKEATLKMMARVLQMPEKCSTFLDETVIS